MKRQAVSDRTAATKEFPMNTLNAPQDVESKSVSPRQPQYAWEMTLEQFQQRYFPELRAQPKDAPASGAFERKAA